MANKFRMLDVEIGDQRFSFWLLANFPVRKNLTEESEIV